MRTLMKVKIPTAAGNEAIKNGSLPEIVGKSLAALNAEAAYFTSEDGLRTGLIFFDMTDSSDIPSAMSQFPRALRGSWTWETLRALSREHALGRCEAQCRRRNHESRATRSDRQGCLEEQRGDPRS